MSAARVRYGFVCYAQRSEDAETDDRSARQVTRYVSAFRRIAGHGKSLRFALVSAPKHDQDLRPSRFSHASFFFSISSTCYGGALASKKGKGLCRWGNVYGACG